MGCTVQGGQTDKEEQCQWSLCSKLILFCVLQAASANPQNAPKQNVNKLKTAQLKEYNSNAMNCLKRIWKEWKLIASPDFSLSLSSFQKQPNTSFCILFVIVSGCRFMSCFYSFIYTIYLWGEGNVTCETQVTEVVAQSVDKISVSSLSRYSLKVRKAFETWF